jgi:hypothetical protein
MGGALGIVAASMFLAGMAVGAAVVGGAHVITTGAFRWRVRVASDGYSAKVSIEARRLWYRVGLDTVKTGGDDFDDRLHAAVAKAEHKVAALNAQRRLGR